MRKFRKITAIVLATSLAAGSGLMAYAADEGRLSGDGTIEGSVEKEIYSVVLPTVSDSDTTFDFVLDPEGLIKATGAAAHAGSTADDYEDGATVYFANVASDGKVTYASSSDALKVTNKGNIAVDVTLNATVTMPSGIALTDDNSFAADETTSLYLALTDGVTATALKDAGANITAEITEAPEDAYEIVWTSDKGYHYALTDAAKAPGYNGFEEYSFKLTGACNTNANWFDVKDATPKVDIVWSVKGQYSEKAPSIAVKTYPMVKGSDIVVNMDFGAGNLAATGISAIQYRNSSGALTNLATSNYTVTGSQLTISHAYTDTLSASREYTIIFNDTAGTKVAINLTK